MTRILASTPLHVGGAELTRRQRRYDRISPPGTTVVLCDLPPRAPRSLECEDDMRASERYVVEALRGVDDGFDSVLADCVLDPGITALQQTLAVPALGILRLNLAHERALGRRTAAVVRNAAIAAEMRAVADGCGLGDVLTEVMVLELDFAAVADHDRWQSRLAEVAGEAVRLGASTLLNGCSAVDTDRIGATVTVYDPVARALALAAAGDL